MKRKILIGSLILLFVADFAAAATINVPSGYSTIQAAIDNANNGDEVVVEPNTYTGVGNRDIDFKGKAITVRSIDPNDPNIVANTIIDCQNSGGGFYFHSGEDANSILAGFTITGGSADFGGGIECEGASPTISNCIITGNDADFFGGGVDLYLSSAVITNCTIKGNSASEGGGITCYESPATIRNCLITENTADDVGGAVYLWGVGPVISNCTIINNNGFNDFGGIFREGDGEATIINSILWNNGDDLYNGLGLVRYSCIEDGDPGLGNISDEPMFRVGPLGGNYYLSQEDAKQVATSPCVDAGSGLASELVGPASYTTRTNSHADSGTVDMGYHYPDSRPTVAYWLTTGVVDANGSIEPNSPGAHVQFAEVVLTADPCDGYRVKEWTGADGVPFLDANYPNTNIVTMDANKHVTVEFKPIPTRTLTISVGSHGTLIKPRNPVSYHYDGAVVEIIVGPSPGYRVRWSGTDDNVSTANTNTVTMTSNRYVSVSFTSYKTIHVPGDYPYLGIQDAINAASNGDVIIIAPGTYYNDQDGFIQINKNITIAGSNPDDPDIVAATIIDCLSGWNDAQGFELRGSGGGTCVLNGLTIINAHRRPLPGFDGQEPGEDGRNGGSLYGTGIIVRGNHIISNCVIRNSWLGGGDGGDGYPGDPDMPIFGADGGNAGSAGGAGIYIVSGSPFIKNTTIEDCTVFGGGGGAGGDGLDTVPGDPNYPGGPGGDGGNAGGAYGAGVYCASFTYPTFENCTIRNCLAYSGSAGDGGAGGADANSIWGGNGRGGAGGVPGPALGAGVHCSYGTKATFINCTFTGNGAYGGYGGDGGDAGLTDPVVSRFHGGRGGFPSNSASGGGVYTGAHATATFTGCTFSGNVTRGSVSGLGGEHSEVGHHPEEPRRNWRIPSFGAGVYCAEDSKSIFTDCIAQSNRTTQEADQYPEDPYPGGLHPHATRFDVYGDRHTGYGGAMCFDGDVSSYVELNRCHIVGNNAPVGGGVYGRTLRDFYIDDCNFIDNLAYLGGALFSIDSFATISKSTISGNVADIFTDPNEDSGEGGGLFCFATEALISDCVITENTASSAGGGVYLSGDIQPPAAIELNNCLVTNNTAGGYGGGISCDWYVEPTISNCTIADNTVVGPFSYGGGLYCSYGSFTNVINSILWGNVGANGSQIAVSGGQYPPLPSTVNISYSDIDLRDLLADEDFDFIDADAMPVIRSGFDTNELYANDDESTGLVDIGFNLNFFGTNYSQLYVNNNGNVTFDANMWTFTPWGLTTNIGTPIIAPFFADVDTRLGNITHFGTGTVGGRNAFGVTWVDVGYFAEHVDKLDSFQMILIDRSDRAEGDFDIEFNYEKIEWETGDASEGYNGLGGQSARVGFSNGTGVLGTFYEFEGSGVNSAFLDSNPEGLVHGSRDSTVNGRYIFSVQSGVPELVSAVPIYVEEGCTLDWWDASTNSWDPDSHNIDEDPDFVLGYYLSQAAGRQDSDSPCVDAGSALALYLGLDHLTTCTNGFFKDIDLVDLGYHYAQGITQYWLNITVGINGSVEPESGLFYEDEVVTLTADPCDGYMVKKWEGTDDDSSTALNNTVTMTEDKYVSVEFEERPEYRLTTGVVGGNGSIYPYHPSPGVLYPNGTVVALWANPGAGYEIRQWSGTDNDLSREQSNTVTVTDPGAYVTVEFKQIGYNNINIEGEPDILFDTIQEAIDAAGPNDVVIVGNGTYTGPGNRDLHFNQGVPLTVRSEFGPVNCIIDCERAGRGFIFSDPNMDPNYVVDGFTITGGRDDVGGAIYCEASSPRITNCRIIDNRADDNGGGIYCTGISAMIITNTEISNNHSGGFGGAVYCEAEAAPEIINCLITYNRSTNIGGSFYLYESSPTITLCTIAYNTGLDYGDFDEDLRPYGPKGGICTREADPEVTNCIIWGNGDDLYGGEGETVDVTFCCIEDLIDSDEDGGEDNIGEDPLFISGGLGDFYLFQEHPDQLQNSPCVNAGEQYILIDLRQEYNLGEITTSVLNSEDIAYTDIGFHYPFYYGPSIEYDLEISVDGLGTVRLRGPGTDVTLTPGVYEFSFTPGMVIRLDAFAESENWGYWSGTDDDISFNTWNTVTMYGDRSISVDFRPIERNMLYVPDQYPLLQNAIDNAGYGDIIMLAPIKEGGEPYRTSQGFVIRDNKVITISSIDPCDPCVVAATVIEMQVPDEGWAGTAFEFYNVGPNTILDGITIRGFTFQGRIGEDGDDDAPPGENGMPAFGGAIMCMMASPTIKNCVIVDCNIMGGDGGDGEGGDDDHVNGWEGGWPGGGYGGGLACIAGFDWRTAEWVGDHWENITIVPSNPTVINCTFDNCSALGGDGGDGGDGNEEPMGLGGRGGGWYYGESSPWYNVPWPYAYSYHTGYLYYFAPLGDGVSEFYDFYTKYSGLGGAAYVGPECSARFIGCTFTNNRSEGGLCGISGQDEGDTGRQEPGLHWKIDNFGGAVYCDVNSLVKFDNCKFIDNLADPNRPIRDYNEPQSEDNYANDDSFVGFGGAVAFRDNANVDFNNCTFSDNEACEGGAMYWIWSDPRIGDCNFANNSAGSGGAILCVGGSGKIARSAFTGNTATGLFARGGAICSLGANAMIVDCNISYNDAVGSGGGIYISSEDTSGEVVSDYSEVTVKNCLITNNFAGIGGGGISANWYSDPNIINCTIADNTVTGGDGGGIFCSYGNYTNIINSIIWGNSAEDGDQIAIGISYNPSTVSVSYSNVQGGAERVDVDTGCELIWDYATNMTGTSYSDPLFVNGYYLSQTVAGQDVTSPCVDAGSADAHSLDMYRHTTRTDRIYAFESGDLPGNPGGGGSGSGSSTLTITSTAGGKVATPGGGQFQYDQGDTVPIVAQANVNYRFVNWKGTAVDTGKVANPSAASTTVAMHTDFTLRANFDVITQQSTISIAKCKVKAGKRAGQDSIKISGLLGATANDLASAGTIDVNIYSDTDDYLVYSESLTIDHSKIRKGKYRYKNKAPRGAPGCITSFKLNTNKHKFSLVAKNINLTGLGCPLSVEIRIGDYSGEGHAGEGIVNGRRPIPIKLMNGYADVLRVDKVRVRPGKISAKGGFALENGWNSLSDIVVTLGGQTFTVPAEDFYTKKNKKICKKVDIGNGIVSAKFDLVKCKFKITIKNAPVESNSGSVDVRYAYAQSGTVLGAAPALTPDYEVTGPAQSGVVMSSATPTPEDYTKFGVIDIETVDMGYHYILKADILGDFNFDGVINVYDVNMFLLHWLEGDCAFPYWCHEKDLNQDGVVNEIDEEIFMQNFGLFEQTPPMPNPMTWAVAPVWDGDEGGIAMTATTAVDNSGYPVQYRFQRLDAEGNIDYSFQGEGDWQSTPYYLDKDVELDAEYGYRVKARDTSVNENETDWSVVGYAIMGAELGDMDPPTPNPMTWATPAYTNTTTSITLSATIASDVSGVEYYFESADYPAYNSGWQDGPTWQDTGLDPNTTYGYRVIARDKSANCNTTGWSSELSATTLGGDDGGDDGGEVDELAPSPEPTIVSYQWYKALDWNSYVLGLTATPGVADESGVVEYRFVCHTKPFLSSEWQVEDIYYVVVGAFKQNLVWQIQARDAYGNTTALNPSGGLLVRGEQQALPPTLELLLLVDAGELVVQ